MIDSAQQMTQTLQQRTFDKSVSLSDDAARFLAAERQIDEHGDASLTPEAGEQAIAKLMAVEREVIARMAATPGTRPADILANQRGSRSAYGGRNGQAYD